MDGSLDGYCINFADGNGPAGYLVLNAEKYSSSYIREFALSGNGIYDQLVINSGETTNVEEALYSTSPVEYAVKYTEGSKTWFYNSNSTVLSELDEYSLYKDVVSFQTEAWPNTVSSTEDKEEYFNAFFYGTSLTGYTSRNNVVISGADSFTPYIMDDLRNGSNSGNCGPTAVANICAYYYDQRNLSNILIDGDITKTYERLVSAVGFDKDGTGDGNPNFGYSTLKTGLRSYVQGRGYRISVYNHTKTTWTDIQSDVNANRPSLIYICGNYFDRDEESWTIGAHALVGIGYRTLTGGSQYVRVCDGWNASNDRFVHFGADSITYFESAGVSVTFQ